MVVGIFAMNFVVKSTKEVKAYVAQTIACREPGRCCIDGCCWPYEAFNLKCNLLNKYNRKFYI